MRIHHLVAFWLSASVLAAAPRPSKPVVASAAPTAEILLREVHYDASLTENEARFGVDVAAEVQGKGVAEAVLFQGEVAAPLPTSGLPPGVRLARTGTEYRLLISKSGTHKLHFDLRAKITRRDLWNEVSFTGPEASIATLTAGAAVEGVEVELLAGAMTEEPRTAGKIHGVLDASRQVALRWQAKRAEITRAAVLSCDTTASAVVSPTVIKLSTQLRLEILQGKLPRVSIALPANQTLTRVQGADIRDWQVKPAAAGGTNAAQVLSIEFLQPLEHAYTLTVQSEQALDTLPATNTIGLPEPLELGRESGAFTLSAEETVVEPGNAAGLRQVNAPPGALAAYEFSGRPVALPVTLKPVEPVLTAATRATARLEDTRLLVIDSVTLIVEKAGLYRIELGPVAGMTVTDVRGEGIEDWKVNQDRLSVTFASKVLGNRTLEVQRESTQSSFPKQVALQPLRLAGAAKETAVILIASGPGIRLKTDELNGLREVPIGSVQGQREASLAFIADQGDWRLRLNTERLEARIVAEIFNLITIGDGLVGGSATIRYALINQGVQEIKISVPSAWKNLEFTGPNIRRKDFQNGVWTINLQDKAWGGYTLVVTYDQQFDPHSAVLALGGIHALGVERETGTLAITSAADVQLREKNLTGGLRRIDEGELAATDRALVTRSVLLAYRQPSADAYTLEIEVSRFDQMPLLNAVADRTQLTTVLTETGQLLTQAAYMVKNNDKAYQRFTLPKGAQFWSCRVDGQSAKAERQGEDLLVPLPRGANRDRAFPVELVYAQKLDALKSKWAQKVGLQAPKTDLQTTYAEWELYIPPTHELTSFGGNLQVASGAAYGWREAWVEFRLIYQRVLGTTVALAGLGSAVLMVAVALLVRRRGWGTAVTVVATVLVAGVAVAILIPNFVKARARAQQEAALLDVGRGRVRSVEAVPDLNSIAPAQELVQPLADADEAAKREKAIADREQRLSKKLAPAPSSKPAGAVAFGGRAQPAGPRVAPTLGLEVLSEQPIARDSGAANASVAAVQSGAAPRPEAMNRSVVERVPQLGDRPSVGSRFNRLTPLVAGIRPIQVDIPRTGQRFFFQKVLNVRDDSLSLSAWAIERTTFYATRSAAEIGFLLIGVVLFWRQVRRVQANALIGAIGVCLALASVTLLLIQTRCLGIGLAAALPLVALTGLMWLAPWTWKRLPAVSHAPGTDPGSAPAHGAATVLPLMALALFIPFARGAETAAGVAAPQPPPAAAMVLDDACAAPQASILTATYSGKVTGRVARMEATLTLSTSEADQTIVLFGDEVAVESFSAKPGDVRLVRVGKSVAIRVPKKGNAALTIRFLAKLAAEVTGSSRRVSFGIPPALASQVAISVDEPEANVEFPSAVSFHSVSSATATQVEGLIGAANRLELNWSPRVKRAAEIAATVFCRNVALVSFRSGSVNTRATFNYEVNQGEQRELKLSLPAKQRLLRVEGEQIRTWQVRDEGAGQVLTVELLKSVGPAYRLVVETESAIGPLPATWAVALPHALDVKRETGWVGLAASDGFGATVASAQGIQQVDTSDFLKEAPGTAAAAAAYQFRKPEFTLNVRVEELQPQIEAVVRNWVRVGGEREVLTAQVDFNIKRAGVFGVRLSLPAGFRLESLTGTDVAQWSEQSGGTGRIVEVALKRKVLGSASIALALATNYTELPKTLSIEGVQPLGTHKLTGWVIVSSDVGVQTKAEAFTGLTEVPISSAPANPAAAGTTGLAYEFVVGDPAAPGPSWNLAVANEATDAWVRAEVVSHWSLTEALLSARALVRFDIQNAPVKFFRVRVPMGARNVELTGANIRQRDHTTNEWRVELQNKVIGSYTLTVTWEQAATVTGQETEFALAGLEAVGVERETGALTVVAHPPLHVSEKATTTELMKIDTGELPGWSGSVDPATVLAYRYLRPGYQLTLRAVQHQQAGVLQALADDARLTTVVAEDGQMMTELALIIRNNGRQFLELSLPPGAQVWSAFVAGEAVRASQRAGKLLLPLERNEAAEAAFPVTVTYITTGRFPDTTGPVALASPGLDVPIKSARWDLYLPADYRYSRFAGTMRRGADDAVPSVTVFSSAVYHEEEARQSTQKQNEALGSINQARSDLSLGKFKEAARSLRRAQGAGLDDISNGEMVKLGVELKRLQSGNLIAGQQAVVANNADFFNAQETQVAQAQSAPESFYDTRAAELQWDKLQQAQEIIASRTRPLHVNLPTTGLHYAFNQVLQTETGQPMELKFVASNLNRPAWGWRIGSGLLAFLALWAVLARVLPRPRLTAQPV